MFGFFDFPDDTPSEFGGFRRKYRMSQEASRGPVGPYRGRSDRIRTFLTILTLVQNFAKKASLCMFAYPGQKPEGVLKHV